MVILTKDDPKIYQLLAARQDESDDIRIVSALRYYLSSECCALLKLWRIWYQLLSHCIAKPNTKSGPSPAYELAKWSCTPNIHYPSVPNQKANVRLGVGKKTFTP
jgi:hypothetical protein